jgi:hypothetical protein
MTTTPLTDRLTGRVFHTRYGTNWHADPHCRALDTARLNEGGTVLAVLPDETADRRPCLVCADDATEWVLTPDNVGELWELIDASKPRFGADPVTGRTEPNGLTIWPTGERVWVRFGDTIRMGRTGRITVTHAAQES